LLELLTVAAGVAAMLIERGADSTTFLFETTDDSLFVRMEHPQSYLMKRTDDALGEYRALLAVAPNRRNAIAGQARAQRSG
jgi:hypothetical protein